MKTGTWKRHSALASNENAGDKVLWANAIQFALAASNMNKSNRIRNFLKAHSGISRCNFTKFKTLKYLYKSPLRKIPTPTLKTLCESAKAIYNEKLKVTPCDGKKNSEVTCANNSDNEPIAENVKSKRMGGRNRKTKQSKSADDGGQLMKRGNKLRNANQNESSLIKSADEGGGGGGGGVGKATKPRTKERTLESKKTEEVKSSDRKNYSEEKQAANRDKSAVPIRRRKKVMRKKKMLKQRMAKEKIIKQKLAKKKMAKLVKQSPTE